MAVPASYTSFAVGSMHGPRSSKWVVTVSGRDVYFSEARTSSDIHLSLHASGRWHVKARTSDAKGVPVLKSHRSICPDGAIPIAIRLAIPDSSLRPASDPENSTTPDIWLDRPPYDGMTEVIVLYWSWALGILPDSWPGMEVGAQPFAFFKFSEADYLALLVRQHSSDSTDAEVVFSVLDRIEWPKRVVLDSPERRVVIMSVSPMGSLQLIEHAID